MLWAAPSARTDDVAAVLAAVTGTECRHTLSRDGRVDPAHRDQRAASLIVIPELLPRSIRVTGLSIAYAVGRNRCSAARRSLSYLASQGHG